MHTFIPFRPLPPTLHLKKQYKNGKIGTKKKNTLKIFFRNLFKSNNLLFFLFPFFFFLYSFYVLYPVYQYNSVFEVIIWIQRKKETEYWHRPSVFFFSAFIVVHIAKRTVYQTKKGKKKRIIKQSCGRIRWRYSQRRKKDLLC